MIGWRNCGLNPGPCACEACAPPLGCTVPAQSDIFLKKQCYIEESSTFRMKGILGIITFNALVLWVSNLRAVSLVLFFNHPFTEKQSKTPGRCIVDISATSSLCTLR